MDDTDHSGRSDPQPPTSEQQAAREASSAFDRQLIIAAIKSGLATMASFVNGVFARLCGVITVPHLTSWTPALLIPVFLADIVCLTWSTAQSPPLRFLVAAGKHAVDKRQPHPLDLAPRHALDLLTRERRPRQWLTWTIYAEYAMCGALMAAIWTAGLAGVGVGVGVFVAMIGLRAWIQHVVGKQMAAAARVLKLKGWPSPQPDP